MVETWRPVVGWEDTYEVSSTGRVRSIDRTIVRSDGKVKRFRARLLKQRAPDGRPRVTLSSHSKPTHVLVSVLVAAAFHGARPPGAYVLHGDDNSANNCAPNLRYGSQVENMADAARNGRNPRKERTHCPRQHPLAPPNVTQWKAERGQRQCRACALATSYIQRHGGKERKTELADRYYEEIMRGDR